MKRNDYISWDEYFMGIALLSAQRSKDPNTQVGACAVDKNNRIISVGYNGMPFGCDDNEFPWGREGDFLDVKYPFVIHAEANVILNSNNLENSMLYTTLFPCNECAKLIIQSGIKHIIYLEDKYYDIPSSKASRLMLGSVGITYSQYEPERDKLEIKFK